MPLYFITGNKNKFEEAKSILSGIEQLDIDLPEIQSMDSKEIIISKLEAARKYRKAEFIVEDTSLCMDCLNELPGPLVRWFLKSIGNIGLFNIAQKFNNYKATAKTVIGYLDKDGRMHFFEGLANGIIVFPETESNFGWDPIFKPDGSAKTFAGMNRDEKNMVSMRRLALNNFLEFIRK